jgi:hypothetical protein
MHRSGQCEYPLVGHAQNGVNRAGVEPSQRARGSTIGEVASHHPSHLGGAWERRSQAPGESYSDVIIRVAREREVSSQIFVRRISAPSRRHECGLSCGPNVQEAKNVNHFNDNLAEREGFEPPVHLRVLRISSAVRSTTLPPLRGRRRRLQTRAVGPAGRLA